MAQTAGKVVHTGDALICVNNKTDSQAILGECRSKLLLTMTFMRKNAAEDAGRYIRSAVQSACQSPAGDASVRPGKESKVFLQIHAALEGERLHASKSLLMQGQGSGH